MDPVVRKFIFSISGITIASVLGYLWRRRNPSAEMHATPIMFYNVTFGWTAVSFFAVWLVKLELSLVALPIIAAIVPMLLFPFGLAISKLHKLDRQARGTYLLTFGMANIGATMGGFICYCMYGLEGMGYSQIFAMSWWVPYICFYYCVAQHFGQPGSKIDVKFILSTIFDRRSLPMLGGIVGLTLNLAGVKMPAVLTDYYIVQTTIIVVVLLSFFTVGLQLHLGKISQTPKLYVSLGLGKFVLTPILVIALVTGLQLVFGTLPETAYRVVILEAFMPTAIYSVMVSNLFNLKPRLASTLFLVNTASFLIIVLPVLVIVFRRFG